MLAATAASAPAYYLRFTPHQTAARFISFYSTRVNPRITNSCLHTLTSSTPLFFSSSFQSYQNNNNFRHRSCRSDIINNVAVRRSFCYATSRAVENVEDTGLLEKASSETGTNKVREFRKRLSISDVKGGSEEGLDRLGQKIVVKGWVRTLRVQSSITFFEVIISLSFSLIWKLF